MKVEPLGLFARLADYLMIPFMFAAGGFRIGEALQKTHWWNNYHLKPEDVEFIPPESMVHCRGIPGASRRHLLGIIPLSHMPILGGWRDYVVLEPTDWGDEEWYVGWISGATIGVSRIPSRGKVRTMLGTEDAFFFGITAKGEQIGVREVARGRIGDDGPYRKTPLR